MAASSSKEIKNPNDQVTCAICLELYSDPRLLPCLHTYCKQCLQDLLAKEKSKESVVCSECREEIEITSGDVTKLKVNFLINNLLSLLAIHSTQEKDGDKTELTCENCDSKEPAKGRCVNCCMFLCNVCFTAHQRLLALKDHQLMTLDELKDTGIPVIEKQSFCGKHKGEVMKLFCNSCQELICRDCTIIDHRDHEFSFIEDVAYQHKESLKTEIRRASDTRNKVETALKSVQEMKEKVEKTSKATEKDVDDFIDQQIKALEEKRVCLKEETRRIAETKSKDLTAQENNLAMHLSGLKSSTEFTEKILKSGCNSDVLSISKEVSSRLKILCERQFNEKPCQRDGIGLKLDKQIFKDWMEHHVKAVDACLPDPKQCLVTQSVNGRFVPNNGPVTATHGQVLKFVVCVSNAFGDKLRFMEDWIEVMVEQTPSKSNLGRVFGQPASGAFTFGTASAGLGQTTSDGCFGSGQSASGGFAFGGFPGPEKTQKSTSTLGSCDGPGKPQTLSITTQIQDIESHEDNTYSFDYCFNYGIAEAEINVTIDGVKIQGCPFQITCDGYGRHYGYGRRR